MDNSILFGTFNARYLTFEQVAETFIPTNQFYQLISNTHTLIMGPRGSGKTTSLKMLSPLSLSKWSNSEANFYKDKIPFIGIYIPCDIRWKKEIENVDVTFKKNKESLDIISHALVNNIVISSIIETFKYLLNNFINDENQRLLIETELSKLLIRLWDMNKPIGLNFYGIEFAIQSNIVSINKVKNQIKNNEKYTLPSSWYLDYFSIITSSLKIFEEVSKRFNIIKNKINWALCFDELEIAPDWLQENLFSLLRSTADQNILLKLTTSPIVDLEKTITGRPDHDYNIIRMWTYNQQEFTNWNRFCNRLVTSRIESETSKRIQPELIFGKYNINSTIKQELTKKYKVIDTAKDFQKHSLMWYLIKDLITFDTTFKNFLISKKINLEDPSPKNQEEEDKIHRKIKPIIIYRYLFQTEERKRTRKNVPLYFGLNMLYELCDGNPRSVIGLINRLLRLSKRGEKNKFTKVPILSQSRVILETSQNYFELISSNPQAVIVNKDKLIYLDEILNKIGFYFHNQIVNDEFNADPKGTFIVDKNVNKDVIKILEIALYLGAIIYMDPTGSFSNHGLEGKKFRLTYLLSPKYRLPKIKYKSKDLSVILNKQTNYQENFFYKDENTED